MCEPQVVTKFMAHVDFVDCVTVTEKEAAAARGNSSNGNRARRQQLWWGDAVGLLVEGCMRTAAVSAFHSCEQAMSAGLCTAARTNPTCTPYTM